MFLFSERNKTTTSQTDPIWALRATSVVRLWNTTQLFPSSRRSLCVFHPVAWRVMSRLNLGGRHPRPGSSKQKNGTESGHHIESGLGLLQSINKETNFNPNATFGLLLLWIFLRHFVQLWPFFIVSPLHWVIPPTFSFVPWTSWAKAPKQEFRLTKC